MINIDALVSKRYAFVWTGALTGVILPFVALFVDIYSHELHFTMASVSMIYEQSPSHWVTWAAPFMLAWLFYIFRKTYRTRELFLQEAKVQVDRQMNQLQTFIEDIAHGKFSEKQYAFENAQLSALLTSLKQKLINQREEDNKARWVAEGHARFAEVLRQATDLDILADEVVKNLVRYVDLNQGAIFIHEKDVQQQDERLIQKACYAYDRKKHTTKSLTVGEGLVGQCFLENDTIILKQVPENYIRITSGLGEATPGFVILVPIKANGITEGVIEMAGFKPIEEHQIKFIEKVSEGFASVLRSAKVNNETRLLLDATQVQTEQLRSQEEEIRQNLEEMQATQEQLSRQLEESKVLAERVGRREMVMAQTTILSETDLYGTITFANDKFCEVSKYSKEELMGKPHSIVRHPDMPKELFKLFWNTIQKGEVFKGVVKNKARDGNHYWVEATIVPIKDTDGEVIKYVGSRYHIVDDIMGKTLYNRQAEKFGWPTLV